jgi:hypothetical protein
MRPSSRAERVGGGIGAQPSLGSVRTVWHTSRGARHRHARAHDESKRGVSRSTP